MKPNQYIELYGVDSGFIQSFKHLCEAHRFLKELKQDDIYNGIHDKYYFILCEELPDKLIQTTGIIRKYKYVYRFIVTDERW